jgi:nitroreductase
MPDLTPDQLLSTTRSVRRRLDLDRPVPASVIDECLALAVQAPTTVNRQHWHFVVVTEQATRTALGDIYRRAWSDYAHGASPFDDRPGESGPAASSRHLARSIDRVPVLLVPCVAGRPEGGTNSALAELYGSVVQASWSFQLALRARGLGSVFTTYHLDYEEEAAAVLGIPFAEVTQVALLPIAYTIGTDFKPAPRRPMSEVVHRERW